MWVGPNAPSLISLDYAPRDPCAEASMGTSLDYAPSANPPSTPLSINYK